jgi:hypothetical protein
MPETREPRAWSEVINQTASRYVGQEKLVLSEAHKRLTLAMYLALNVPLDQLPYTTHFELFYREFIEKTARLSVTRNQLWRWLANARKAKGMPKLRTTKKPGGGNPPVDRSE